MSTILILANCNTGKRDQNKEYHREDVLGVCSYTKIWGWRPLQSNVEEELEGRKMGTGSST